MPVWNADALAVLHDATSSASASARSLHCAPCAVFFLPLSLLHWAHAASTSARASLDDPHCARIVASASSRLHAAIFEVRRRSVALILHLPAVSTTSLTLALPVMVAVRPSREALRPFLVTVQSRSPSPSSRTSPLERSVLVLLSP